MALPASYIIDQIRSLAGKARVSDEGGTKKMERVARFPKDDWQLPILTPDPEDSECLLVDQVKLKEDGQFVDAYRVYLKLPGTVLSGQVVTADGQVGTLTQQRVAAGTAATQPSATVVSASVRPENAAVSVKETITVPSVFDEKAVTITKPDLTPAKFEAAVGTEEISEVLAGTSANPSLASDETSRSEQRLTEHKIRRTRKKKAGTSSTVELVGKRMTTEFGGGIANVTERLKTGAALTTAPTFTTLSAQTDPLGDGRAVEEVIGLPDGETWPELVDDDYDAATGLMMEIRKTVIPASPRPTTGITAVGVLTEVKALDKWRSIQIVSKLQNLSNINQERVYYGHAFQHSMPDVLEAVEWVDVLARKGNDVAFDFAANIKIKGGYAGLMEGRIREVITPSIFYEFPGTRYYNPNPQRETIALAIAGIKESGPQASASTIVIPPTVHGVITIDRPFADITSTASAADTRIKVTPLSLPATEGGMPPEGQWVVKDRSRERWRFGLNIFRQVEVKLTTRAPGTWTIVYT